MGPRAEVFSPHPHHRRFNSAAGSPKGGKCRAVPGPVTHSTHRQQTHSSEARPHSRAIMASVFLGDLDDFIAPGQACINPLFTAADDAAPAAAEKPGGRGGAAMTLELEDDGGPLDAMVCIARLYRTRTASSARYASWTLDITAVVRVW